ncbi:MAG: sigma-70 family RNA polymerase sigma factor [Ginsengibacter sp.]
MKDLNVAGKLHTLSFSSSSEGLWERFCNGDRDALSTIYRNHVDDLFHYGMHFCRDSEIVKDCLQDLFQNLWMEREHLSSDVLNIRYYLLSSLRRRLLRSLVNLRKTATYSLPSSFDFELIPPQEEVIIQDEIHHHQVLQLREGIAALSRRQREAVYLRFYQNLSYSEVAHLMSMKTDSVYNLIYKAIGLLKNSILLLLLMSII